MSDAFLKKFPWLKIIFYITPIYLKQTYVPSNFPSIYIICVNLVGER